MPTEINIQTNQAILHALTDAIFVQFDFLGTGIVIEWTRDGNPNQIINQQDGVLDQNLFALICRFFSQIIILTNWKSTATTDSVFSKTHKER